jgi:hypothetical protein
MTQPPTRKGYIEAMVAARRLALKWRSIGFGLAVIPGVVYAWIRGWQVSWEFVIPHLVIFIVGIAFAMADAVLRRRFDLSLRSRANAGATRPASEPATRRADSADDPWAGDPLVGLGNVSLPPIRTLSVIAGVLIGAVTPALLPMIASWGFRGKR